MDQPETRRLLRHVSLRRQLIAFGRRLHVVFLVLAAVYLVLLLAARLLALIPCEFKPPSVLLIPGGALAAAVALWRRFPTSRTARLIDTSMDTGDLFLTAALLDRSAGEFKPLVVRKAEAAAPRIQPRNVAPLQWRRKTGHVSAVLLMLLACVLLVPQFDPFGSAEERNRAAQREKQLAESRRATALRKQILAKRQTADLSPEVNRALEELKRTFDALKKQDRIGNLRRLNTGQKQLSDLWRRRREARLRDALSETPAAQRFGAGNLQKTQRWRKQLRQGNSTGVKQELDELKTLAQRLQQAKKPAEQEKLRRELKQRLKDLADFMSGETNSQCVNSALQRALDQLGMSGIKGLSSDALQGLRESLDLSQAELDRLIQSLRDMQALENALKALQMCKALNTLGECSAGQGCKTIEDYARLYAELMEKCGGCQGGAGTGLKPGVGAGMGGPGIGRGNVAPEDDSVETDFKPEKSRSALHAGKMLMQWKQRGLSDPGEAVEDYRQYVNDVKQGLSEAVLQERVPPGYHETIQKYFDTMEEAVGKPGG